MTLKTSIPAILLLTFLFSCNSSENQSPGYKKEVETINKQEEMNLAESEFVAKENDAVTDMPSKEKNFQKIDKKKIIKDGHISIKSENIASSKKNMDAILKKLNAYYETEELLNDDQTISYNLKLRIPSENFENLIIAIENGKDEIINKNIQARDVTAEFMDIESRLTNKRAYLEKYKALLSKAASVKDILEIEENIRILQEEIESKEGQLKYMSDQVAFSTLDISLYQEKAYIYKPQQEDKFSERVKHAISSGWDSIVDFILWLIIIWPLLIILPIIIILIRRFLKNKRAK